MYCTYIHIHMYTYIYINIICIYIYVYVYIILHIHNTYHMSVLMYVYKIYIYIYNSVYIHIYTVVALNPFIWKKVFFAEETAFSHWSYLPMSRQNTSALDGVIVGEAHLRCAPVWNVSSARNAWESWCAPAHRRQAVAKCKKSAKIIVGLLAK